MICQKCNEDLYKDSVGNWCIKLFGILQSHNISCDNKYIKEAKK
jgi:hypothetical protein